jgi:hypothetical protein
MKRTIFLLCTIFLISAQQISAQEVNGLYIISNESLQKFYQLRNEEVIKFDLAGLQNIFLIYTHECHPQLEEYYRYRYDDFQTVISIFQFPPNELHEVYEDPAILSSGNLSETSINKRIVTATKAILKFPTKPVTYYQDFSYDYAIYMQYDATKITTGRLYNFNFDNSHGIEYWEISFVKISDKIPEELINLVFNDYLLAESFDRLR